MDKFQSKVVQVVRRRFLKFDRNMPTIGLSKRWVLVNKKWFLSLPIKYQKALLFHEFRHMMFNPNWNLRAKEITLCAM